MHLLCGLGNPGKKYENTRHNIGFRVLDKIISNYEFKEYKSDKSKKIFKGKIEGKSCYLLKPLNYVNLSGKPIKEFSNYYKIITTKIIVIHDDLDLKVVKVKYKIGGGNGGHNGLTDIDHHIGNKYYRLRIGIGHPGIKNLVGKYVLEKFNKKDEVLINTLINNINKNICYLLKNNKDLFLTKVIYGLKL